MNAVKLLLAAALLAAPAAAQEPLLLECKNIQDSVLCPSDGLEDPSWAFLNNFTIPCDSFYGCGLGHHIINW